MANPYRQGIPSKRPSGNSSSCEGNVNGSTTNGGGQRIRAHQMAQSPRRSRSVREVNSRNSRSPDLVQMSENINSRGCSPSRRPSTASCRLGRTSSVSPSRLPPTMTNPEGRGRKLPATPIRQPNLPSKRLELTLNKFTTVALPLHLNVINQHAANIERLQKLSDWNGIRFEVDVTTNAVHALGALLFEMEVIRSYLEPHELPYFDATLAPAQNSSVKALNRLQGLCPINTEELRKKDEDDSNTSTKPKVKWVPNGFFPHNSNATSSALVMSNKCSSSVGDLTTTESSNGPGSKFSSLSSQNMAVVSLSNSPNSPSVIRRLPGSCNDINDFKNSNGCHSPSFNHLNSSPRFTFQKSTSQLVPEHMSSQREDNDRSRSFQSLHLSPLHLRPPSTSAASLDIPYSPQKYRQHSPRPQDTHIFSYSNPQEETTNNNTATASKDISYVPPSPLQLWKIGQTDAIDDNDCAKKSTNNRPFCEFSSINSVQSSTNNSKDKIPTTNHSPTSHTTITSSSQSTPGNNIQSSGTAKKRGQTANHHIAGGGGTLEVLYEDPKEDLQSDVLSILSCGEINDDDKKKLIEEIACGNHSDASSLKSNKNGKLSKKNIFSRFASSSADSNGTIEDGSKALDNNAKFESCAQKTEEEIILEKSWLKLDEEIKDVNLLIDENYHADGKDKGSNGANGRNSDHNRDISTSAIYPVAGALFGTCLGGPVGLLAGVKIGGLAAIGGSVFGYSTGSIIKQQKERQEYIDEFYASHSPSIVLSLNAQANEGGSSTGLARANNLSQYKKEQWSSQRAHSLPDVLSSKKSEDNGGVTSVNGGTARVNTKVPRPSLSRNNSGSKKHYHVRFDLIAEDAKNYHRPSLPNHVAGLRRAQSARRNVTRSTDNLLY